MSQSLAKLLVHLVYSTKHRAKWLPHECDERYVGNDGAPVAPFPGGG